MIERAAKRHWALAAIFLIMMAPTACISDAGDPAPIIIHPPLDSEVENAIDLDSVLTDGYIARHDLVRCVVSDDSVARDLRRTVRGTLPDSSGVVVFVRAGADSALQRVEVVRRPPETRQVGVTWNAADDSTMIVLWPRASEPQGIRRFSQGGPAARRLRELGTAALRVRCPVSPANTAPPAEGADTALTSVG